MPQPRKTQVSLDATPYYHCVSRCVRRAFLCGKDSVTGESYEHRRQWIETRLLELASIFAIDIVAYGIMSNHYHVVLHINRKQVESWAEREVVEQWHQLFSGNLLSQRYSQGELLSKGEYYALSETINEWRQRLMSISWFMRCLNEPIAREANHEDEVTGRFWEGRFKSQALLDEKALIACIAYVDLNPIRAGIAKTPEQSDHTSIKKRIKQILKVKQTGVTEQQPEDLLPFVGNSREDMPEGIPFSLTDYIELVDWTGRIIREDKKGFIPSNTPPILQRLNIEADNWVYLTKHFEQPFTGLVGAAFRVRKVCKQIGKRWVHGIKPCERFFPSS